MQEINTVKNRSFLHWDFMQTFKWIPLVIALVHGFIMQGQTFIPGGFVSGSWPAANSPYIVEGNLLVHPDSSLSIAEGTTVLFAGPYWLEVQGQLLATGTPEAPVHLTKYDTTAFWRGIYLNTTDTSITDSSLLDYCHISDCLQSPAVYLVNASRTRLNNCHITRSNAFRGGGIYCIGSNPRIEEVTVDSCRSLDGGGVFLEASSPYMVNCTITANRADGAGGGIVIWSGSAPLIENCTFSHNEGYGSGGGVYVSGASPVFRRCHLTANNGAILASNLYSGGAVSVKLSSNARFENCIFEQNISFREGGGIATFSPSDIINCLFSENNASVSGGAIFAGSGGIVSSALHNCTFADNDSPQGTALASLNHTLLLKNCILWKESPTNPGSLIYLEASVPRNVFQTDYSDIQNGQQGIEKNPDAQFTWGQGNIDLDPEFEPESHELSWQSPCIETATPDTTGLALPEYDLAGNPRLVNERVDMGAYEYQLPVSIHNSKFIIQNYPRVFPVPADERLTVEAGPGFLNSKLQIFSASGALMYAMEMPSQIIMINTSKWPAGLYLLRFFYENEMASQSSQKIIIR